MTRLSALRDRLEARWRARSPRLFRSARRGAPASPAPGGWRAWLTPGRGGAAAASLALLIVLYYLIGMVWIHTVDDDPAFAADLKVDGGSHVVAVATALIDREVEDHRWTPNDPFFMPSAALDNMPAFQHGIIQALSRFAIEMTDQIGRTRGSSKVDADLEKAAGLLKYPPNVWFIDPSTSWTPTAASEKQYRSARRALAAYNDRLRTGEAVFERRADNLLATLDRISKDLGSASATLDAEVRSAGGLFDTDADNTFYNVKGRLYAYFLLLRGLRADFDNVVVERELESAWDQMAASFRQAATLDPLVVLNGDPDSAMVPSHTLAQGFYLLRARIQLDEITNILLK